jgi:hypothetical protein
MVDEVDRTRHFTRRQFLGGLVSLTALAVTSAIPFTEEQLDELVTPFCALDSGTPFYPVSWTFSTRNLLCNVYDGGMAIPFAAADPEVFLEFATLHPVDLSSAETVQCGIDGCVVRGRILQVAWIGHGEVLFHYKLQLESVEIAIDDSLGRGAMLL